MLILDLLSEIDCRHGVREGSPCSIVNFKTITITVEDGVNLFSLNDIEMVIYQFG